MYVYCVPVVCDIFYFDDCLEPVVMLVSCASVANVVVDMVLSPVEMFPAVA